MKKNIYPFIVAMAFVYAGCNTNETLNSKSVLTPENTAKTELDAYIYDNFQKPYNVTVTYRWEATDFELNKFLYPPTQSKVKPLLEIMKKVWISPYEQVAGANFIKEVAPRQISLVGGYNVNESGTITLGFADSGMKITLFNVDQLDAKNHNQMRQYFHTIQHEYCHIINQKKPFDVAYGKLTPADYTANWYNVSTTDANNKGFITPYAMANEIEDFAEVTSAMLSMSKADFDAKVNAISDAKGKAFIRQKEAFVVEYFKREWNIDIYKLQEVIESQMLEVLE